MIFERSSGASPGIQQHVLQFHPGPLAPGAIVIRPAEHELPPAPAEAPASAVEAPAPAADAPAPAAEAPAPVAEAPAPVAEAPVAPARSEAPGDRLADFVPPKVPLPRLLWTFLYLGGISIGGRSASYLQNELVERRGWLRREHWLEGHVLGKILPGPSGIPNGMFMAHMLGGPAAAAGAMVLYVVPGVAIGIGLSMLIFGFDHPSWADNAIRGLAASALGLFIAQTLRNLSATRVVRFGPVAAIAAFVAHGLFAVDLFVVLGGVGLVLLLLNWPGVRVARKEASHE